LVLALVSPFAALGFLFVMHGIAGRPLGAPPAVFSPDAIAVAGIAEDDVADRMTSRRAGIAQPRLSAVWCQQISLVDECSKTDCVWTGDHHPRRLRPPSEP
jgi:hypothetical protein